MGIPVQLEANQTVTQVSGTHFYLNIPGDLAADNTFTFNASNVSDGNTVTIDGKVYTFKTAPNNANDGEVDIGTASTNSRDNLLNAINLGAGAGTSYSTATTLHPTVFASAGTALQMFVAAKIKGVEGNKIPVAETSNGSWVGSFLINGADGTRAGSNDFVITLPTNPQEGTEYQFTTEKNGIGVVDGSTYFTNWKINSPVENGFVVRIGQRRLITTPTDNKPFTVESIIIGFPPTSRGSQRGYKLGENIKLNFYNGRWRGTLAEGSNILGIGDI